MSEEEKNDQQQDQQLERKVYVGVKVKKTFYFNEEDKDQFIEVQKLTEGKKGLYEDRTARTLSMSADKKMEMPLKAGTDRKTLIELSVVRYKFLALNDAEQTVEIEGSDIREFMKYFEQMDGEVANELFEFVKKLNPWVGGLTEEDEKK